MSVPSPGIVVVGSINADLVVTLERHPRPGETVLGRTLTVLPGGKGANQAVAAALLGADVTMVGAVGDDAYAETALSGLHAAGADLRAVRRADGSTGVAIVEVSDDGENTIVVLSGANTEVTPDVVAASADAIRDAAVVVVQGELSAPATAAAVRAAAGRVIVNLAPVMELDREALLRADPLVVNEHEGELVLAQFGGAKRPDHEAVVTALLASGFASVVMTLGGEGALMSDGGPVRHVPAPRVTAVDTTGAGDAFVGALAARLVAADALEDAVRFAVRVGSYAVQYPGAQPSYPTPADELPEVLTDDHEEASR
ncbi:ribokinase [Arthrobacter sp. RIT-PI-e]|uniref:ribokinase n=1 Tax=Arthrobacter sp. RIT-PI-e TaxID=1681197 RepID=UPI0006764EB7|nr:ribokinase [Arthrobacter sp. RIT-PI-e]KNC19348.1 ribokinase [Arthrobacter sp. RIT-PI-e]